MNSLLEQFLTESRESLEGIGEKLMQLESAPDDQQLMTELFRLVHTLKGNSGLFEFPEMSRVLHAGEDLMDAVRHGDVAYSQVLADCLLDAMDFVGELCNAAQAQQTVSADMAQQAVRLAQSLRALINGTREVDENTAPQADAAREPIYPAVNPEWLERVPQDVLRAALDAADAQLPLYWVRYTPGEECFFQGEDPLHQSRQTPGFVWGAMQARGPWPQLAELDAYRCMLDFDMLVHTSMEDVLGHYRYVPEQIQIYTVGVQVGEQTEVHGEALAPAQVALHAVLHAQREVLALPDDVPWLSGRLRAAATCLRSCLLAVGRDVELPQLDAAEQQALADCSARPLSAWLNAAFAPPQTSMQPASLAGKAQAAPGTVSDAQETEAKFSRRADDTSAPKSLRVDQDKIDRLMNLIGEMVVAKNAIPYLADRAEDVFGVRELSREIKTHYAVINRISEEMQDAIMQVRMMPVSFVFQRFPRLVRDTSRRLGKDVNLVLEGQDTAADKNIIESLGDPLVHIVRNSLDHGLELPEVRKAAGKPVVGTLRIVARQESDRVVIEISDDGKGIDPQVIKTKAFEKGLINASLLERISDQEAVNLVFAPGFSTAEIISDLSGRGVGMDVVRTAIEQVNGSIALESVKGRGTVIRLSLPLSMAVTTVLTVESDGQRFGVPMDMVLETVRVPRSALRTIKQSTATVLRNRIVPIRSLNSILGLAAPPLSNNDDELATLVVRVGDETLGILVDEFHQTADIILKPLGGVLSGLRSYAGSALMGDGSVLMVLNVKEIL